MKKLMFAAAVAAGLVAFGDGLESQNTVGYETRSLTADTKTITGANFVTVGQNSLNLQSITMDSDVVDGGAQIWWWNTATGKYNAQAFWYTELYADEEGETTLGYAGWGDPEYWMPISKTFAPGESFWIQAGVNASVTIAGEVLAAAANEEYVGIDLTADQKVQLTNPFPVGTFSLQSIKMDDDVVDGGAQIWWWNSTTGKYDAQAFWYTELYADEEGETTLGYAGWGDPEYWMPITKTFAAGEGFWIQVGVNATVKFPNPFYVAE